MSVAPQKKTDFFRTALPVWLQSSGVSGFVNNDPKGFQYEKNIHAGFRTVFSASSSGKITLRLAGATLYRIFLNGKFIHHGPARGPHGFYRVDELDLSDRLYDGKNLLAIEVAGYNSNSFAYLNQSSFLQAELMAGEKVLAATGAEGFQGLLLPERIRNVERYSFQRPFVEAYYLNPEFDAWRTQISVDLALESMERVEEKNLISRRVAVPDFNIRFAKSSVGSGKVGYREISKPDRSAFWWMVDTHYQELDSITPDRFELDILKIYQSCFFSDTQVEGVSATAFAMAANQFRIFDFGINCTGFIGMEVQCSELVRVMVVFDEVLLDGDVGMERNGTLNMVYYELAPGHYLFESIEPYTLRYCKVIALDGAVSFSRLYLREFINSEAGRGSFFSSDPALNLLFEAGRETFRQNAIDLYMDCPGRERAGWLCDSFFTGRVEPLLCGNSKVEKNFIENYMLPGTFNHLPDGMLPMCYPSEHSDGQYIPQWAMWLVLELEEYLARTRDGDMVQHMESKVRGLLEFFKPFENGDGLLENLPGWNFIEWSKANDLTEGVNYPTNMLYARMLESAAGLYHEPRWELQAKQIHELIRVQAFDGTVFRDHAVRGTDGILELGGESTEVCQYYAFFCGTASLELYPDLWQILLKEFGPDRKPNGPYEFVHPANAFIGYYLRMELLSLHGEIERLLDEMKGYFLGMAERTGTLWEHGDERASCNHGFASHICVHLYRDVLGIRTIDLINKTVELGIPTRIPVEQCSGMVPVGPDVVEVKWSMVGGEIVPQVSVPEGWIVLWDK